MIYYPKGYTGPILNPKMDITEDVNRLAWYEWAIKDSKTPPPRPYTPPDTKKWSELNIRAFVWSLMP